MICRNCNAQIEGEEIYECPNCEAVLKTAPARREKNRPAAETVAVVESSNYNGKYQFQKLTDGSYFCDCLSFLFQNGTKVSEPTISHHPFMTCKHIRRELINGNGNNGNGNGGSFIPPSAYQKTCLKKLGVNIEEHLTNAQAYYILKTHLERQGLRYDEFKKLIIEHLKVEFLPLNYFGVEFEGGLGCSKEEFKDKLGRLEIESLITSYDHTLHNMKWKLGSDSSVSIPRLNSVEIVSPKLYGALGFGEVTKVLKLWNETLPFRQGSESERINGVNSSCGTHVHVDASYGWDTQKFFELAKVWVKIEQTVVWYFVSPSRRNKHYCKAVDLPYLEALSRGHMVGDRYYSLNLEAYQRQGSIEYRIHNGTLEPAKIIPWVTFCLMLTDAVKKGLTYRDFEPTFDGVMDAVGMNSSATPLIKEAKSYLTGRFQYWKEDAQRNPSNVPSIPQIDIADIEGEVRRRTVNQRREEVGNRYQYRLSALTRFDANLPTNSVHNLASRSPSGIVSEDAFSFVLEDEGGICRWLVPARLVNDSYTVSHNTETDTLSCNCRGFRTNGYCYHSINLARYIYTQRELEAVETRVIQEEVNNV